MKSGKASQLSVTKMTPPDKGGYADQGDVTFNHMGYTGHLENSKPMVPYCGGFESGSKKK